VKISDLQGKNVVIWGTGHEARAAAALIHRVLPDLALTFADDQETRADVSAHGRLASGAANAAAALEAAGVVIKSPGISPLHPVMVRLREKGTPVTSLLNLWFGEPRRAKTICVTGTKGKSTVASIITHALNGLGQRAILRGNIGEALGAPGNDEADYAVIEVSSYQAAGFDGTCDIGVLTSLYPEHLDWHGSLDRYYRDKLNLLAHA
jgi:UDP-N-acetylmuramoylalanine--D-glutamate ligase